MQTMHMDAIVPHNRARSDRLPQPAIDVSKRSVSRNAFLDLFGQSAGTNNDTIPFTFLRRT